MQDLIGGQIPLTFDTNVAAMPQIKAGKVKAIAVTSAKPTSTMPGVPTIASAGYAGYEMVPWITVVAPRGLPAAVSAKLVRAYSREPGRSGNPRHAGESRRGRAPGSTIRVRPAHH